LLHLSHRILYEKGGIILASQGSVIVRVYTSNAFIPLPNAPVSFFQTQENENTELLAFRYTNSSGLTEPVYVATPDSAQSQTPGNTLRPYSSVDILVSYPGYRSVRANGVQIFPGVETIQGLQLQPELPGYPQNPSITSPQNSQNL